MTNYQNLSVPFNVPIPGGLSAGKTVVLQGSIPSMSQRFAVNLLTRSGDIAFHLSPKFKENKVIRNNVLNMTWGPEESHGSMPVHPGQSFEITISCESYSFKVTFNGHYFCDFSHRLPMSAITNLAVDGDVVVHKLNFKDGYGNNNNNYSNSVPYGYDSGSKHSSGGLYPTIDPYPSDNTGRSPSPSAPTYGGFRNPSPTPPSYPTPSGPTYPSSGGGSSPSLYPAQPGYPTLPHHGPYPQVPSPTPGGGSKPNSHSGSGFLDQAGAALAGVLGPAILAGGMNRGHGRQPNLMDDAGRALSGIIGGTGPAGGADKHDKGTPSKSSTPHSGSGSSSALLGILGGVALAGAAAAASRSLGGSTKDSTHSTRPTQHGGSLFDHAGSALAGILGGGGLTGATGRPLRGFTPPPVTRPTHHGGTLFDQAGSALAGILGGGGLAGPAGHSSPSRPVHHGGSLFDQAGSALADILGGGGLAGSTSRSQRGLTSSAGGARSSSPPPTTLPARSRPSPPRSDPEGPGTGLSQSRSSGGGSTGTGHHKKHKKMGILGGALGTAVAGAALTGHLNPIKATKKQLKAHKKALKYGLPIAGAGLGAYALHKGIKKGFRRGSSSSSSSSCSSSD